MFGGVFTRSHFNRSGRHYSQKEKTKRQRLTPYKKWTEAETNALIQFLKANRDFEKPLSQSYYQRFLTETGMTVDWKLVRGKVANMRVSYNKARAWKVSPDSSSLREGVTVEEMMYKICPLYDELHKIFGEGANQESMFSPFNAIEKIEVPSSENSLLSASTGNTHFNFGNVTSLSGSVENMEAVTSASRQSSEANSRGSAMAEMPFRTENMEQETYVKEEAAMPLDYLDFDDNSFILSSMATTNIPGHSRTPFDASSDNSQAQLYRQIQFEQIELNKQQFAREMAIKEQELVLRREQLSFEERKHLMELQLKEKELLSQEKLKMLELEMKERLAVKELQMRERLALKEMEKSDTSLENNTIHIDDEEPTPPPEENEDAGLVQLLFDWGFAYKLDDFKERGITMQRLPLLTEEDIINLFRNDTIGARAEFRHHLTSWRNKIRPQPNNIQTNVMKVLEKPMQLHSRKRASTELATLVRPSVMPDDFDIQAILNDHPAGAYVLRLEKLDDTGRKMLVAAVISWCIKRGIKLGRNLFMEIAQKISERFGDDKSIYFYKDPVTGRQAGRLFDKYNNTLKRLRKIGEVRDLETCQPIAQAQFSSLEAEGEEITAACHWLKTYDDPWSAVEEKWKITFKKRRQEILNADGSTLVNVFANWKKLAQPNGHKLIDIDFRQLYPSCSSLLEKWQDFKLKIVPILERTVKEVEYLQCMEKIKLEKGSDQLIALLVRGMLRPSTLKRQLQDKPVFTSTITDSEPSFILRADSMDDAKEELRCLKASMHFRGETSLKPLIIAIGNELAEAKFFVYHEGIKYELPSFVSALDVCFKSFMVFKLPYPKDSVSFWTFLQRYFYAIELPEDQTRPNMLSLIADLS